jgi:protein-tyrosine phosphatase
VDDSLEQLLPLRYAGAHFQMNAGSLLGLYGDGPRRRAAELLARGWVEYGSSDFHARGTPAVAAVRAMLTAGGAAEHADLLFSENTARLVRDESPRPVPPLALKERKPHPWWARLFGTR